MLDVENLFMTYGHDDVILNGIDLHVDDGECLLLTGESGSGKSSIINTINGLALEYDNAQVTGEIRLDGRDIRKLELYEISSFIATVFQNPKTFFFNIDTTLELLFYLENMGLDRQEMNRRMDDMLKVFDISHLLGRSIFELSGGEKQILSVASCYVSGCKVIVLDEPSSNLDDDKVETLKSMLKVLKRRNISLVIAEHRIHYLMDIVDRVALVDHGQIEGIWKIDEFRNMEIPGLRSITRPVLKKTNTLSGSDLVIRRIFCSFKNHGALSIEDMSFEYGRIYGITGRNGCGKSTFLRIMTGIERRDRSRISLGGKVLGRRARIRNSSLVMQDVNHQLFTESVEKEMRLGIRKLERERMDEVLDSLGVLDLKERHPLSLSGGQKQRIAIASAVCKGSRFIYFDEPTSGMDYNSMVRISMLMKRISRRDNIIFIVSHDIEFLNLTADRIFSLESFRREVQ